MNDKRTIFLVVVFFMSFSTVHALSLKSIQEPSPMTTLDLDYTTAEDWEQYIVQDVSKMNETAFNLTLGFPDNLSANIQQCLALSGANENNCFNALGVTYSVNTTRFKQLAQNGSFQQYPLLLDILSGFDDLSARQSYLLDIKNTTPRRLGKIGWHSINISVSNTTDIIFANAETQDHAVFAHTFNRSATILFTSADGHVQNSEIAGGIACYWFNDSDVLCYRNSTATESRTVRVHAVEFTSGITVNSYNFSWPGTNTTSNVTINTVANTSQTFIILNGAYGNSTNLYRNLASSAMLFNASLVKFVRLTGTNVPTNRIHFQVVEIPGSMVQRGTIRVGDTKNTTVQTTPFNTSNAALFYSTGMPNQNFHPDAMLYGEIQNGSLLRFGRDTFVNLYNLTNVSWELVEFKNNVSTQQGRFQGAGTLFTTTITTVNTSRATAWAGGFFVEAGLGAGYANSSTSGGTTTTFQTLTNITTNGNNITLYKVSSAIGYNTTWQVIEWPVVAATGGGGDTCTYGGSGNWDILCSDNCVLNSNTNLPNNNITFTGTGTATITATIDAQWVKVYGACWVTTTGTGAII